MTEERFQVVRLAGEGGMGVVYQAIDRSTGGIVALKLLHASPGQDEGRFVREARLLAALHHPHIVRFIDRGTLGTGERYLAMEWLEGETLEARLARGPLGVDHALQVGQQIAGALSAAHAAGIVHRDLKPANVFLVGGSVADVKVLDFGIARAKQSTLLTAASDMIGTPGYMAPEQILGTSEVSPATDIYALGCILFRCISGRAPFEAESLQSLIVRAAREEAPRLSSVTAVPAAVDAMVAAMLDRAPERRPASRALELIAAARRNTTPRGRLAVLIAIPLVAAGVTLALLIGLSDDGNTRADGKSAGRSGSATPAAIASATPSPMCMPPMRCVRGLLRPPRMHIDALHAALVEAAREDLGPDAYSLNLSATEVDVESLTANTESASASVIGGGKLAAVRGYQSDIVVGPGQPLPLADLPRPRCRPSEVLKKLTLAERRYQAIGFGLSADANRNWAIHVGSQTFMVPDDCP